ncbi:MAG: hypothetical protein ACI85O_002341 [Saprospiraceae bacterium]
MESIASTSSFLYFGLGAVFLLLLAFFGYQRMKN